MKNDSAQKASHLINTVQRNSGPVSFLVVDRRARHPALRLGKAFHLRAQSDAKFPIHRAYLLNATAKIARLSRHGLRTLILNIPFGCGAKLIDFSQCAFPQWLEFLPVTEFLDADCDTCCQHHTEDNASKGQPIAGVGTVDSRTCNNIAGYDKQSGRSADQRFGHTASPIHVEEHHFHEAKTQVAAATSLSAKCG